MNTKPYLPALILLASLASFAAILVAPAIPALAAAFHTRGSTMEWALSAYLIGYAGGQVVWGPVSSRWGRKRAAQAGLLWGLLATVLCVAAGVFHHAGFFIVARALMGFGFGSGLVMSMAMIADTHTKTESRQAFSLIVLCFALVPAVAIISGGVIIKHFDYQVMNYLVLFIGFVTLISVCSLKETSIQRQSESHVLTDALESHVLLFKNKSYLLLVSIYALTASISYIFNGISPFIGININHVNPEAFSLMSIFPSIGILLGGFMSNRLAKSYSSETLIFFGLVLALISGVVMVAFFIENILSLVPLFACAFVMFSGMALVIPNASMSAVHAAHGSASAAGLMNAIGLCVASALAYGVGAFVLKLPIVLPASLVTVGLLSLLIQLILNKKNTRIAPDASLASD